MVKRSERTHTTKFCLTSEFPWTSQIVPCGQPDDSQRAGPKRTGEAVVKRLRHRWGYLVLNRDVEPRDMLVLRDKLTMKFVSNPLTNFQQVLGLHAKGNAPPE